MRFQVQLPDAADLPQDYPPYLPNMQVLNSDRVSFIQFAESPPLSWMSCLWQKLYSSPSPRPTENSDKAVPSWTELVPSVDSGNLRTPKLTFPVDGSGSVPTCHHWTHTRRCKGSKPFWSSKRQKGSLPPILTACIPSLSC